MGTFDLQASTATDRARAALRYLAQQRLSPTPDQYRRAWDRIGGWESDDNPADSPVEGECTPLGPIVAEAVRWIEIPQRNWTCARKKEALRRVLGCPSDAARLACRLSALVDSWKRDESDSTVIAGEAPDADPAAESVPDADPVVGIVPGACPDSAHAKPQGETVRRLLAEMTRLLVTVCETVPTLVEEEAWVRRQFDAIRASLDPAGRYPDRRDLTLARDVLRRTAEEHQRLLKLRRDSLQMMKSMLTQCVDWLRTLTESSDRFGGKLGTYMEEIRSSSDLTSLAGVIHRLIEETRSIYAEFDASRSEFAAAGERARRLQEEVERLAGELDSASTLIMTDHMTQVLNRRGFERSFAEHSLACRVAASPLSLALIDVDDFKKLNDVYGHQRGDEALRHLARVLSDTLRPADVVARYGGEEFIVLLPSVPLDRAVEVIRRAQRALTNDVYLNGDDRIFVTFSAGVAQAIDDEPLDSIVERADDAMYRAKRAGKNQVFRART